MTVFVTGLVVSLLFFRSLEIQEERSQKAILTSRVRAYATLSTSHLQSAVQSLTRMAAWWLSFDNAPQAPWSADAHAILDDYPSIDTVRWVDSSLELRWQISRSEDLWNVDEDLTIDPAVRQRVEFIKQEHGVVIGPIYDRPDQSVMFMSMPLYSGQTFHGLIATDLDLPRLLADAYKELGLVSRMDVLVDGRNLYEGGTLAAHVSDALIASVTESFGPHEFTFVMRPSPQFIKSNASNEPLAVFLILLLVTSLCTFLLRQRLTLADQGVQLRTTADALDSSVKQSRKNLIRLQATYDTAPIGICFFDRQGRFIDVNQRLASFTQLPLSAHIGHTLREIDAPLALILEPLVDRVLRTNQPVEQVELKADTADGDVQYWLCSLHPVTDPNPDTQGVVCAIQEITQIKEAEAETLNLAAQLHQAQKTDALGRLTGGIAHDFNNMLGFILGGIEFLKDRHADDPQTMAFLDRIDTASERAADLIKRLLAFARQQPLSPKTVDVADTLKNMEHLMRRTLGSDIDIHVAISDSRWSARVDPAQLESAILNLALNARDAMPNGGNLTIEVKNVVFDEAYAAKETEVLAGDYISIDVSDTGTGIPPDVLPRVFEPFFTTKPIGKGTGLGLSMVFGFAKQSGGHLKIYSEVGHGTTVHVYLPRALDDTTETQPTGAPQVSRGNENLLLVEDDPMMLEIATITATGLGYAIHTARSGAEALSLLDTDLRVDLMVTDVVMSGGMNGPELAQKALIKRPRLKVLFVSGYTATAIEDRGWLANGGALLQKPYRRFDFARKVREALEA